MTALGARALAFATLLVLSAVSGIVLSALGRPPNTALLAVHKLIAVAAVVLAVLVVVSIRKGASRDIGVMVLAVVGAVLLLSLLATGALLSQDRPVNAVLLALHKAAPLLTAVSAALVMYLHIRRGA